MSNDWHKSKACVSSGSQVAWAAHITTSDLHFWRCRAAHERPRPGPKRMRFGRSSKQAGASLSTSLSRDVLPALYKARPRTPSKTTNLPNRRRSRESRPITTGKRSTVSCSSSERLSCSTFVRFRAAGPGPATRSFRRQRGRAGGSPVRGCASASGRRARSSAVRLQKPDAQKAQDDRRRRQGQKRSQRDDHAHADSVVNHAGHACGRRVALASRS